MKFIAQICIILHNNHHASDPLPRQTRQAFIHYAQLHKNAPFLRAGEAGEQARAKRGIRGLLW
ncbi:hypothetical protein CKY05_07150 [Photorhabdus sp. S10-54]|nr:hypothetical protein CKY05_07150 [Photorhabdus sp. S10-54]